MPRRRFTPPTTPAQAMRAAIAAMGREMRAASPERAGALAEKLARLALALAAEDVRVEHSPENRESLRRMRAEFDAEVERLIEERVEERVRAMTHSEARVGAK